MRKFRIVQYICMGIAMIGFISSVTFITMAYFTMDLANKAGTTDVHAWTILLYLIPAFAGIALFVGLGYMFSRLDRRTQEVHVAADAATQQPNAEKEPLSSLTADEDTSLEPSERK